MQVVLNDWNSSVSIGVQIGCSTLFYTSPDRLTGLRVSARPYHDLYALVCCLFEFVHPHLFKWIRTSSTNDEVIEKWAQCFAPAFWRECVQAAERADYDTLQTAIKRIMLSSR